MKKLILLLLSTLTLHGASVVQVGVNGTTLVGPTPANLRTAAGLVIGTDVLAPTGSGAGLTGINSATISTSTESTNAARYPVFVTASGTQTLAGKTNANFQINPATGVLTAGGLTTAGQIQTDTFLALGNSVMAGLSVTSITGGTGSFSTLDASGAVTGLSFTGSGAGLTALSAANVSAGTLAVARGGTGITAFGAGVSTGLGNAVDAAGGLLTFNAGTLASGMTASSLTSVGTLSSLNDGGALVLSGRLDVTLATSPTDWAPTGIATVSHVFVDGSTADRTINGMISSTGGRILGITNKGTSNSLILAHGVGTAGNKFTFPGGGNVTLAPDGSIELRYDGTAATWRPWGRALSNTGVTAASYGSTTAIPVVTFDLQGRATAASTAAVVAPAGTVTGATLASNVLASSLTSVGNLTSLNVAGNLTATSTSASITLSPPGGIVNIIPGTTGTVTISPGSTLTMTPGGNTLLGPTGSGTLTLTSTAATTLSATGSGVVTINSAAAGTINNMSIGATTPLSGAFTTFSASGTAAITGAATVTGALTANGGIELGNASDTTFARIAAGRASIEGVEISTASNAVTLTNKRMTKRAPTVTQSATPTINTDATEVAHITGLAQAITSMTTSLSGTPVEGDVLRIDITDNGTARAITWGASFEAGAVALPTTTAVSVRLDAQFFWNTVTSKWRCMAAGP